MKKRYLLILILSGLFLLTVSSSAKSAPRFTSLFCPECWTFLRSSDVLDMKGNCARCGKYPVELEVRTVNWYWCARQLKWLGAPCALNAAQSCCVLEEGFATFSPPGSPAVQAWYCPADRTFDVLLPPLLRQGICGVCARPAIKVPAARHTWFWCASEGGWTRGRPLHPSGNRCVNCEGLLLAIPESGPLAGK